MIRNLRIFFLSFVLSNNLYGDINDYIYPFSDQPSFSNYGTIGLIQMPSARMMEEGSIAFTWSMTQPYLRGSIVANPFSWFEASYQYTDVNNKLYSEFVEFSGKQSYKDKGFDAKFGLFKESKYLPAIAIGFRDLGGSGLFGSEYVVASKRFGNVDLTGGLGWGKLTQNSIKNPFRELSDSFDERILDSNTADTQGGEFNFNSFFRGENAGTFFGAEILIPKFSGSRIKLEYDGTDYDLEGYEPVPQESRFNYSFLYPVTKNFHLKIGYVRGNVINLGFSYSGNYKRRDPFIKKTESPKKVPRSEAFKFVNAKDNTNLYVSSLKYLASEKIYLQTANLSSDGQLHISYNQNKHTSHPRAIGRGIRILDQLSPPSVTSFKLTNLNAGQSMFSVDVQRDEFIKYEKLQQTELLRLTSNFTKEHSTDLLDHEYQPEPELPAFFWKLTPSIRSQIGGPDGFYFGDISLTFHSDLIIKKNFNFLFRSAVGIYDTFDNLKLASDSVLPHVRSDIVKYLKQSKEFNITRAQFNYLDNPFGSLYYKFSAGIFEHMFGGFGTEVLYRPFYKNWAIGAEAWRVKQRDYDMMFAFRDYETTTGHINLYYKEPKSQVTIFLKGGRYLAGDSGVTLDLSRRFDSGFTLGVFASKTDISKFEFGEGSFDKGFYFHIPIEVFYSNYSRGITGFGLRPLTRDGAQYLTHGHHLWGITDQGSLINVDRDWSTIYE